MSAMGEPSTLTLTYPAIPESVPSARHALVDFAESAGVDREGVDSLRLAVSEAITNVVRHAYRGGGGQVYVTAALAGDELWVLIGDDGQGLQTRSHSPGLGMGLALIASVSDHFSVVRRSSGGTEVRMRFRVAVEPRRERPRLQDRGSVASATAPASARFSTIR